MDKIAFLDALKRAMGGLDPAVQAKTLAYYEQRFVDGVAAGRSEASVAAELDDPRKIAMTLRANAHMAAFEQKRNPANALRVLLSATGLVIFNLLMVVPAAVYLSLLAALYAVALGFYIIGIAVTASGLAGANELLLNRPFGIVLSDDSDGSERNVQTHVSIGESGIRIFDDKLKPSAAERAERAARRAVAAVAAAAGKQARAAVAAGDPAHQAAADAAVADAAAAAGDAAARAGDAAERAADAALVAADARLAAADARLADSDAALRAAEGAVERASAHDPDVIEQAEAVAGRTIRITTDVDAGSRATQTAFGLVMVIGAIVLFLLGLVASKYTLIGLKRYFQMNLSLLKGS